MRLRVRGSNHLPGWHAIVTPDHGAIRREFRRLLNGEMVFYTAPHWDPDDAQLEALETRRDIGYSRWVTEGYVVVDRPMLVEGEGIYVTHLFYEDVLREMVQALDRGLCWDPVARAVSVTATDEHWRIWLKQGHVPDGVMRFSKSITHPGLRPLVRDFIHYKLMADRVGDNWIVPRAQAFDAFSR